MLIYCNKCGRQMQFLNLSGAEFTICLNCGAKIPVFTVTDSDSDSEKDKKKQIINIEQTKELEKFLYKSIGWDTGRYSHEYHFSELKKFIEAGADVDRCKNRIGHTLLQSAVVSGYLELAELCLKHGANVNTRDSEGNTPLHSVVLSDIQRCENNRKELVTLLLSHGANIHAVNGRGETPEEIVKRKNRSYKLFNSDEKVKKILEQNKKDGIIGCLGCLVFLLLIGVIVYFFLMP